MHSDVFSLPLDGCLGWRSSSAHPRPDQVEYEHLLARVQAPLDGQVFSAVRMDGRAMKMEQAIEYALSKDAAEA